MLVAKAAARAAAAKAAAAGRAGAPFRCSPAREARERLRDLERAVASASTGAGCPAVLPGASLARLCASLLAFFAAVQAARLTLAL